MACLDIGQAQCHERPQKWSRLLQPVVHLAPIDQAVLTPLTFEPEQRLQSVVFIIPAQGDKEELITSSGQGHMDQALHLCSVLRFCIHLLPTVAKDNISRAPCTGVHAAVDMYCGAADAHARLQQVRLRCMQAAIATDFYCWQKCLAGIH